MRIFDQKENIQIFLDIVLAKPFKERENISILDITKSN